MPVELPIRFRCDGCGLILELPRMVAGLKFPLVLNAPSLGGTINALPVGWWQRDDQIFCPVHKQQQIATATPADIITLDSMRRGRKMN